jgi:hypothetical protein
MMRTKKPSVGRARQRQPGGGMVAGPPAPGIAPNVPRGAGSLAGFRGGRAGPRMVTVPASRTAARARRGRKKT